MQILYKQELAWISKEMERAINNIQSNLQQENISQLEKGVLELRHEQFQSILDRLHKVILDGDKRIEIKS